MEGGVLLYFNFVIFTPASTNSTIKRFQIVLTTAILLTCCTINKIAASIQSADLHAAVKGRTKRMKSPYH